MSRDRRLELIESIEKERKSRVVAYVLSDLPGSEGSISPDAVDEMYRLLCELKPLEREPLDLLLFADRGDMTVPWQMVGMIREVFALFNVIVPHKAHGPATMIALGADSIVMGERGTLSSIEVVAPEDGPFKGQSMAGKGLSAEDARAVMSLMESFGRIREKQRIDAFLAILGRMDPLLLGRLHKQAEQTRADCLGLLEKRRKRFSKRKNRRILNQLFSESPSPRHHITRSEAIKRLGLKQVRREKIIEPLFWELWTLYEGEFKTSKPFDPAAPRDPFEQEEQVFSNCKLAYMESAKSTRILVEDRKVEKVREMPPSIRLDPQIILPPLEKGSDLGESNMWPLIEGWLQGNLPSLLDEAFVRFKKSLPVSDYKRTSLNRRWVEE
jgi:hypothetical protein